MAWMMEGVRWPFGYVDPPEYVVLASNGKQMRYVPERTCHNTAWPDSGMFTCSFCEYTVCATQTTDHCSEIEVSKGQEILDVNQGFFYCPRCGAKVV